MRDTIFTDILSMWVQFLVLVPSKQFLPVEAR